MSGYSQDYIGQLARSGQIIAQRIGGLWYIAVDSLEEYKIKSEAFKPEPPKRQDSAESESFVSFDGKEYISASRAADITGYHQDYVGQLARSGKINSKQVGNRWYVERHGIAMHKKEKDALLAAVQAESVGLAKKKNNEASEGHFERYASSGPLLTYTSDDRDLLPNLLPIRKDETIASVEEKIKEKPTTEPASTPTRISQQPHIARVVPRPVRRPEKRRRSGNKRLYTGMAAAAFTIVIVLSFGFASLKSGSTYTFNLPKSISTASASAAFTKLGDIIENWLAPELVFKRSR